MRRIIVAAAGLAMAWGTFAQEAPLPGGDLLKGKDCGYVVWPAEVVTGGEVVWAGWAGDGKALLAFKVSRRLTPDFVRSTLLGLPIGLVPASEVSLVSWNLETRKAAELWRAGLGMVSLRSASWLGRSATAGLVLDETRMLPDGSKKRLPFVLVADAARGRASVVAASDREEGAPNYEFTSLPDAPYGVLIVTTAGGDPTAGQDTRTVFVLVRQGGALGPPCTLPPTANGYWPLFVTETKRGYLTTSSPGPLDDRGKRTWVTKWFAIDEAKGTVSPAELPKETKPLPFRSEVAEKTLGPLTVRIGSVTVSDGPFRAGLRTAWLTSPGVLDAKGKPVALLLAGGATFAEVGPTTDAALYVSQGALLVRRIQKLSLEDYEGAEARIEQSRLVSQAKICGLATIMYATDNDDKLPGKDAFSSDILSPYTKDSATLEGFIYTFAGGNLTSVASPAETELGHIDGQRGTAVVYLDGHVKWHPKG